MLTTRPPKLLCNREVRVLLDTGFLIPMRNSEMQFACFFPVLYDVTKAGR
jgi:hypothetical protein